MGSCPRCRHDHPPVSFAAWAWGVRDTKPHPPPQQLAVLFMLGSHMDPLTGCGWTTREQLAADAGAGKTTISDAIAWAAAHFLLRKLERGHRRGDGTTTGTWWALASPVAPPSTSAQEDIETDGSTSAPGDIETSTSSGPVVEVSTSAPEDIEVVSTSARGAVEDGSTSAPEDIENGSLRPRGGTLGKTFTKGSVKDKPQENSPSGNSPSEPAGSDDDTGLDAPGARADVDRICEHMAGSVERLTGKRPNITRRWRQAARRLLDLDNRTEQQVITAIDWTHADEFWAYNVLSLPKLREKYEQLRGAAQRKAGANGHRRESGVTTMLRVMDEDTAAQHGYQPHAELPGGGS